MARDVDLLRKAYAEKVVRGYCVQKLELFRADAYPKNLIEIAKVYTRLGNKDEAFRWLDTAFKDHVPYLIWNLPQTRPWMAFARSRTIRTCCGV